MINIKYLSYTFYFLSKSASKRSIPTNPAELESEIPVCKVSCILSHKYSFAIQINSFDLTLRYSDSITNFIPVKSISHSFVSTCTNRFSNFMSVEQLLKSLISTCTYQFWDSMPVMPLLHSLTSTYTNQFSRFHARNTIPTFTYSYV